jgi:hypothetical protein
MANSALRAATRAAPLRYLAAAHSRYLSQSCNRRSWPKPWLSEQPLPTSRSMLHSTAKAGGPVTASAPCLQPPSSPAGLPQLLTSRSLEGGGSWGVKGAAQRRASASSCRPVAAWRPRRAALLQALSPRKKSRTSHSSAAVVQAAPGPERLRQQPLVVRAAADALVVRVWDGLLPRPRPDACGRQLPDTARSTHRAAARTAAPRLPPASAWRYHIVRHITGVPSMSCSASVRHNDSCNDARRRAQLLCSCSPADCSCCHHRPYHLSFRRVVAPPLQLGPPTCL